ncbi:uncharacterized protein LOC123511917 [Portunus trituberculatus]|uniref:uncharacterized protein LOC123511917 n=1 Tax=Portunus trituberculatus TaxID=210409 RepID=UPI001E1CE4DC|nr:uncharacterized protein LOC123511917 [Portunus trituberculatus]
METVWQYNILLLGIFFFLQYYVAGRVCVPGFLQLITAVCSASGVWQTCDAVDSLAKVACGTGPSCRSAATFPALLPTEPPGERRFRRLKRHTAASTLTVL